MAVGYSGTPLAKKLGIKPGMRVAILNAPGGYDETLGYLPDGVEVDTQLQAIDLDCVHWFGDSAGDLEAQFGTLKSAIAKDGMLWISWPKQASKVPTDLTENVVRECALSQGLVDVKVCAVDEVWSGLKLVYRLVDR